MFQSNDANETPPSNVPPIEPMENALTREVWSVPRSNDPIEMNNERAQQVLALIYLKRRQQMIHKIKHKTMYRKFSHSVLIHLQATTTSTI